MLLSIAINKKAIPMKSIIPLFIALCFFQLSTAQELPYKGPDEFLIGGRQVPQVVLMGP